LPVKRRVGEPVAFVGRDVPVAKAGPIGKKA